MRNGIIQVQFIAFAQEITESPEVAIDTDVTNLSQESLPIRSLTDRVEQESEQGANENKIQKKPQEEKLDGRLHETVPEIR